QIPWKDLKESCPPWGRVRCGDRLQKNNNEGVRWDPLVTNSPDVWIRPKLLPDCGDGVESLPGGRLPRGLRRGRLAPRHGCRHKHQGREQEYSDRLAH